MIIPHADIATDTLNALIEEFVTRDGTDYGDIETSTAAKVQQVMNQLERKEVFIVYSEEYETCTIKTKDTFETG
jgi:uncharacterized protein YheU (UPF0270 family)